MKIDKYYGNDEPAESKNAEHQHHEKHEHEPKTEHTNSSFNLGLKIKFDTIVENRYILLGIAALIIILNIVLRAGLLQYQGLFEPDGFFYYSVIRQAINNHFIVSNYLNISGFPWHNFIGEAPGLIYLTVIFYYLLHGITGLSLLTVMRWMPILFGVLYTILAYYLAKTVSNSKALGLIAMLLVSVSSGNIARTAGTVYRGDSFITLFVMLALLLMLKCFEEKKHWMKWVWGLLSSIALASGIVVWTGSPFIIVIYLLALLLAIIYGFIKSDKNVLLSGLALSVMLLVMHFLQVAYVSIGIARDVTFSGNDFFIFYLPILIGSIITYFATTHIHKIKLIATARNRTLATIAVGFVAAITIYALFGGTIASVASPIRGTATAVNTTNSTILNSTAARASIATTTQELQPPNFPFLWSSFNIQVILAIIGIALVATILFYKHFGRHLITFAVAIAVILIGIGLLAYLGGPALELIVLGAVFIAAFGLFILFGEGLIVKKDFKINEVGVLAVIAYFAVTGYMQLQAIRFNAIISVPLSIFAAFAFYGVGKIFYDMAAKRKAVSIIIVAAIVIVSIALIYRLFAAGYFSGSFVAVSASAAFMSVVLVALLFYGIYALAVKKPIEIKYMVVAVVLVLMAFAFYNTYIESYTAAQADGINPSFLNAMTWMKANTPTNATVLALWPDGSVVEGWGNRTSYMDSVGGENGTRIYPFSKFLFNTTPDSSYLYEIGKPEYLIARTFWYQELGGIAQEGLVQNATAYGFVILPVVNVSRNSTTQFFSFESGSPPYYKTELLIRQQGNGTNAFSAYLGLANSTRFVEMRSVILFNTTNGAYSIINTSRNITTANYTLMVGYSGTVVNGAYILGPKLIKSNLFDFTFLCNTFTCAYDNGNATLTNVYSNSDTKIFKISYLR
jgi:asparagine N-glycosylation enzyme membrane subunit Stt3